MPGPNTPVSTRGCKVRVHSQFSTNAPAPTAKTLLLTSKFPSRCRNSAAPEAACCPQKEFQSLELRPGGHDWRHRLMPLASLPGNSKNSKKLHSQPAPLSIRFQEFCQLGNTCGVGRSEERGQPIAMQRWPRPPPTTGWLCMLGDSRLVQDNKG